MIPDPYTVKNRETADAAIAEALGAPWSIIAYEQAAKDEATNHTPRIEQAKQMWQAAGGALVQGATELENGIHGVRDAWPDPNFYPAFQEPVTAYKGRLEASGNKMSQGGHIAKLDALLGTIREVNTSAIPPLVADHNDTMNRLRQLQTQLADARANANPLDGDNALNNIVQLQVKAGEEIVRLERIDQDGKGVMNGLGVAYEDAARAVADAAKDHNLGDAPAAGEAPTDPRRTPNAPGGPGAPGGTPPGGGPQPEMPQQQSPGGQPPGGQPPGGQPGGQPPGGGAGEQPPGGGAGGPTTPGGDSALPDTGLAGAPPTTLPPTTVPDLPTTTPPNTPNLPGSTSPSSTGPLGGIGGGPLAAGLGGSSRPSTGTGTGASTPNVQQAARNLSAPQGAGNGQAPALGRLATGSAGQAGSGFGGVPPMMPPMMPQVGGGQGKPKPGTAPATGTGRSRPAGGSAGVPAGLRGRTAGGGQRRPAVRRARQEAERTQASQPNENVELLDSELWEVDQPSPVTERRRVREF